MTKYIINRVLGKIVNCDKIENYNLQAKDRRYMNETMFQDGKAKKYTSECTVEASGVDSYDFTIFAGTVAECSAVLEEIINFLKEDGSIRKFEHGEFFPEFMELGIGTLLPDEEKPKRKTTKKAAVKDEEGDDDE